MTQKTLVHICVGNYEYVGKLEGDKWKKENKGTLKLFQAAKVMYFQKGMESADRNIQMQMVSMQAKTQYLGDIYISGNPIIIIPMDERGDMARGYKQMHSNIILPNEKIEMPNVPPVGKRNIN